MVGQPGSFSFQRCGFQIVALASASAGTFYCRSRSAVMKQKCKAGRTTDLPSRRHVVGIRRWCDQCIRLPRPQKHRKKTKARHLGLDTLEGVLGPSFFHNESAIRRTRPQKSRREAAKFGLSN